MSAQAFGGRPPALNEQQMRSLLERASQVRSLGDIDRALASEFGIPKELVSRFRRGNVPKSYRRLWTEIVERRRA